jgi:hypothetical protein
MMTVSTTADQLKSIIQYQQDRVRVYNDFSTAFKQYLRTPNDQHAVQAYTRTCDTITKEFQSISLNVRRIEQELNQNESTYGEMIRKIQLNEKEKLETVCDTNMKLQDYYLLTPLLSRQ